MADAVKISDLTARATAMTEDDLFGISEYQGTPGVYESKKIIPSLVLGYKSIHFSATQSGGGDPTLNIVKNDAGVTPTINRTAAGRFDLTMTGAFAASKTYGIPVMINVNGALVVADYVDDDTVHIRTSVAGVYTDNILNDTFFEIRIYY